MTADLDETPLDPAQLRLQARLRRLLLISGGTLALGILAVLIAVAYKVTAIPSASAPVAGAAPIRAAASNAGSPVRSHRREDRCPGAASRGIVRPQAASRRARSIRPEAATWYAPPHRELPPPEPPRTERGARCERPARRRGP